MSDVVIEDHVRPWIDDDGRPLYQLLRLAPGPGADEASCPWQLGLLDAAHPDVRLAAWRIALASMRHRCGPTAVFDLWETCVRDGRVLTPSERRRLDPFLANVFGTPESPAPADHLEGHVAEVLWHLLTIEVERGDRTLRNSDGPSFSVTETGGDGLAIWERAGGELIFRLWEIKKHTGSAHVSRTISRACRQLSVSAERYLAKYASVGSRRHTGELGRFYGRLLDLWIEDDEACGAAVAVATSRHKAPVRRSFGTLVSTFPELARGARLEGLLVAIADFRAFATLVREYVWRGHSDSRT